MKQWVTDEQYKSLQNSSVVFENSQSPQRTGTLIEWIIQHTELKWQELVWITLAEGYGLDIDSYEYNIDFLVDLCIAMQQEG